MRKNSFTINHSMEEIKNSVEVEPILVPYKEINNYFECNMMSILKCARRGFCDICNIHKLISIEKFRGMEIFVTIKQSEEEELKSLKHVVIDNKSSYYLLYEKRLDKIHDFNTCTQKNYYTVGMITDHDLKIIKKCIKYHEMKVFI